MFKVGVALSEAVFYGNCGFNAIANTARRRFFLSTLEK
jgi:hypothetical protein